MSDIDLLRDYARQNSERAFAALVQRHVNLVYSVALRHVRIAAHAEEITQAVFVILAQKASGLCSDTVLEGWLYQTTRLTALRFLRDERRRQFREQEAYMQSTLPESATNSAWEQLAPLLDEAMAQLGKKDRDAVVLRFFKDKSFREIAVALDVTEAAAQRRGGRALEKLRRYFDKRGVTLTGTLIAGAISANSVQAAPALLENTVTATAMAKGATASASTLILIKGASTIMAWSKMKTAIVIGAGLLIVGSATPFAVKKIQQARQQTRIARLRLDRSEERRQEIARIKSRQEKDETVNARTIDLKPYINCSLDDSPCSAKGRGDNNNLSELPPGTNIYAGVPFNVQGTVQLTGRNMNRPLPDEVNDIRIDQTCAKLHLFHGASWCDQANASTAIAKLVLHYADKSTREIPIVANKHLLDWWFPLWRSGLPPMYFDLAPGTERAWTGSNPYVRKISPNCDLILFKSTFDNPQPGVKLSSMDYVSEGPLTGVFMAGLTVE